MARLIKVNFRGIETKEFLQGTTLEEISDSFKKYYNYPILIGKINNHLTELTHEVESNCDIDFLDRSSEEGQRVNAHSLQFLLILATKKVLGYETDIQIENSLDNGVYCEVTGSAIDKPILKKIEEKMKEIINLDLKYTKVSVSRMDAIEFFKRKKRLDKVNMLKYISNSFVNLYRLDDVYDYFFSELAQSTNDLSNYKLTYIKNNGFVLSYPTTSNPETTLNYIHKPMVHNTFYNYTAWARTVGISNASDLNKIVSLGKYNDVIRLAETHYEQQLAIIAHQIYENKENIKLVLLAGPSSSGKTTTAKKLGIYLQSKGFKTNYISIDDYFKELDETPKDENGEYDFESIEALDLELFNKHLVKLLAGEKVLMPEYNFVLGKKEYKKRYLQLEKNDILIIEGLHGLNDKLTSSIKRKNKFKVFICPYTQINIDNHNYVHTSDTRKLRRIIRDSKTRGKSTSDTLKMWRRIHEGEMKNIFPFQSDIDAIINSALVYEIGVLKTYVEPLLFSVNEKDEMYPEAIRLINLLRNFLTIPSDDIPRDSVLREFIGKSGFDT
ncbi:MAG: nucleoside kinase [Bacilli bacterium]